MGFLARLRLDILVYGLAPLSLNKVMRLGPVSLSFLSFFWHVGLDEGLM